jgi:hypothetical protein
MYKSRIKPMTPIAPSYFTEYELCMVIIYWKSLISSDYRLHIKGGNSQKRKRGLHKHQAWSIYSS